MQAWSSRGLVFDEEIACAKGGAGPAGAPPAQRNRVPEPTTPGQLEAPRTGGGQGGEDRAEDQARGG